MIFEGRKIEQSIRNTIADINLDDKDLKIALCLVVFNPVFWNIVARLEYRTKALTKIAGGAKRGCYFLAFVIFSLGIIRDYYFSRALEHQVTSKALECVRVQNAGLALMGVGQVLVLSSMYRLGITGTYLGDYFGILMDDIVTSFPFNVSNNPMYHGSALTFLGTSLYRGKAAGVLVALLVHVMYSLAQKFEEPFTAKIYAMRNTKSGKVE